MAYFNAEQMAALSATTVRVATLVELQFTGQYTYLWNGFGQRVFRNTDGYAVTYLGCGDLGGIDGLEEVRGTQSQQVTFTLSGVPDSPSGLLAAALNSVDIIQGNKAIVSLQLFDDAWVTIGYPLPVYFGIMMPPRVELKPATETEGAARTLTLPTENLFFGRHRPPAGRYTDKEQQQRWAGDKFCEYTPQLKNLTINWPDY
jgi:hypothetical protein